MAPKIEVWSVAFAGGAPQLIGEGDDPVMSPKGDVVAFDRDAAALGGADRRQRRGEAALLRARRRERCALVAGGVAARLRGQPRRPRVHRRVRERLHAHPLARSLHLARRLPALVARRLAHRIRAPAGAGGAPEPLLGQRPSPWAIWIADVATGEGRPLWKSPETLRGSVPGTHGNYNLHWASDGRIVFLSYLDGWPHLYSVSERGGEPLLLTPGRYMAEHVTLSPDGRTLLFTANAGATPDDLERRHVVRVPVDRAQPEVLTPGTGLEWSPVATGDGGRIAFVSATAQRPPLVATMDAGGGTGAPAQLLGADRIPADFPSAHLVTPRAVTFKAADGIEVHAQLFEAQNAFSGRPSPAIVYVHGGPPRQMLLGWHYSDYYTNAYASNQYLASLGYIVLSVNYRLGIGYGHAFHRPAGAGSQGAAEYQDVKAAGEWLRRQPWVDGRRIGIYGGSYGGYLTALALARNSDLFAAGVDIHGVHDLHGGGGAPARDGRVALRAAPTATARPPSRGAPHRCRPSPRGSRRCCSCTATTTATCASAPRSISCAACPPPACRSRSSSSPTTPTT